MTVPHEILVLALFMTSVKLNHFLSPLQLLRLGRYCSASNDNLSGVVHSVELHVKIRETVGIEI